MNPAAARSCLSSSVSLLIGNWKENNSFLSHVAGIWSQFSSPHTEKKEVYLVGYSVGAWRSTNDVVEPVGDCGVLHDVTSVDYVWTSGWDLYLDLITSSGGLGEQTHPGEQLGDLFCRFTAKEKSYFP